MFLGRESFLVVVVGSRVEIINGLLVILVCNFSGFFLFKFIWICGIEVLLNDDNYEIGELILIISDV